MEAGAAPHVHRGVLPPSGKRILLPGDISRASGKRISPLLSSIDYNIKNNAISYATIKKYDYRSRRNLNKEIDRELAEY